MDRHYETKRQDASLQNRDWSDTVQANEEYKHVESTFLTIMKKYGPMWDGHLDQINVANHCINLNFMDVPPIHSAPYRAGPKQRKCYREELEKMGEARVVEPAVAEMASVVVSVPKKNGSLRSCLDCRRLSAVTERDKYPIPQIDVCIYSLDKAEALLTLEASFSYWQVETDDKDIDKTALVPHHGHFEYTGMPLSLESAHATVRRAMDVILALVKRQKVIVYFGDVIIF